MKFLVQDYDGNKVTVEALNFNYAQRVAEKLEGMDNIKSITKL